MENNGRGCRVILLGAFAVVVTAAAPDDAPGTQAPDVAALAAKAKEEGHALVIVGLNLPRAKYKPESLLSLAEADAQRAAIAASRGALIASLKGYNAKV